MFSVCLIFFFQSHLNIFFYNKCTYLWMKCNERETSKISLSKKLSFLHLEIHRFFRRLLKENVSIFFQTEVTRKILQIFNNVIIIAVAMHNHRRLLSGCVLKPEAVETRFKTGNRAFFSINVFWTQMILWLLKNQEKSGRSRNLGQCIVEKYQHIS